MTTTTDFRIVSLVPSLTETICHFGLIQNVVGCTSFCVEPKELRHTSPSVGGTKDARIDDILKLRPSHIVVNREENTQELLDTLKTLSGQMSFEVVETFLETPQDNFALVELLGRTFKFEASAHSWISEQQKHLAELSQISAASRPFQFAYFIWMNPWMVAGQRTYISNTLALIHGANVIQTGNALAERYPAIEPGDERLKDADVLLFSSEPFPFKNRHLEEFRRQSENSRPQLKVDGQALSWYGSRFAHTLNYLGSLHAEIQKALG